MSWLSSLIKGGLGAVTGGLFGSAAQGAGGAIGAGLAGTLFGNKRVSSSDAAHNEILLDRHQSNQNRRDVQTLEQTTPAHADAHNTMRDMTYAGDTAAMDQRNKTLFYDKGVTPWELAGTSAATPYTAPSPMKVSGNNGNFLSSAINANASVKAAETQQQTALMQESIRAKTARDVAKIQTDPQHDANAIKEVETYIKSKDVQSLIKYRGETVWTQKRGQNLQAIAKIVDLLPEEHLNTLFIKSKEKKGYREAIQFLTQYTTSGTLGSDPNALSKSIPAPLLNAMLDDLRDASEAMTTGSVGLGALLGIGAGAKMIPFIGKKNKPKKKRKISEKANPSSPYNKSRRHR